MNPSSLECCYSNEMIHLLYAAYKYALHWIHLFFELKLISKQNFNVYYALKHLMRLNHIEF